MVIAADTSFLFSLYGSDSKTPAAVKWSSENSLEIVVTILSRFELINALRFAECRRFIPLGKSAAYTADFESDLCDGRLVEQSCDLTEVMVEAFRLSQAHTLTGGHRGFDILHVASAKLAGATHFLTFDANQKKLAEKEGLIVPL